MISKAEVPGREWNIEQTLVYYFNTTPNFDTEITIENSGISNIKSTILNNKSAFVINESASVINRSGVVINESPTVINKSRVVI